MELPSGKIVSNGFNKLSPAAVNSKEFIFPLNSARGMFNSIKLEKRGSERNS